ncbi:MAG: Smr/MutS family protein [Bacteroidota bacterium]|nr:Smr/MutS family protein [Bacteroidota bacterium]
MIYPENFETKVGFDRIRNLLAENCLSPMGRELAESMIFMTDIDAISFRLSATYEFQRLLQLEDYFPSENYFEISGSLNKIRIEGSFPEVHEVFDLKRSLDTVRTILNFFRKKENDPYPGLKSICSNVKFYPYVLDAAERIIDKTGKIKDNASQRLKEIRNEAESKKILVSKRLNTILKQAQADGIVDPDTSATVRNGRGVIPVNAYDKRKISGLIHDQSASGKTVYIEPAEIVELNNDLIELEYEERREIVRILTAFADDIRPYIDDLLLANDFLGKIDFIRAKALLGNQLGSVKPSLSAKPGIFWNKAVHPILDLTFRKLPGRKVVPLDIRLDDRNRIIVISGPNAGGKSVCLKTVGLLQYMVQCGLTIPAGEGSESGIFNNIFIDIGDEQSIENDLSTYSSHLLSMKYFLKHAAEGTLLLIDEFGTGTEPMLGGSIAEAILGELNRLRVFGVLTTHYTNLKHFASMNEGIVNGAMLFDNHLMQPLFLLSIGKPGSSFAFEIARKIGLPEDILKAASEKAGVKNINYDRHLKDIARDKRYWENKRQNIRQHEKHLEELISEYEKALGDAKDTRKEIISRAKDEAQALLNEANRVIENTIREIREAQAEKERTRAVRLELEEFRENITEETRPVENMPEDKTLKLDRKAEKIRSRIRKKAETAEKPEIPDKPLKPGDPVRMKDTLAAGEVLRIEGNKVQVETGSLRLFVPVDKVERISRSELKKSTRPAQVFSVPDPVIQERRINFKPEIDIRGARGEEALNIVRDFLDDALLVQHRNLRILHGKGNGILRQLVRQYLSTVNIVKSYRDEDVQLGGSGITVVEMDF